MAKSVPAPSANSPARRSSARLLLDGPPGREGFRFHDGHNQPVHWAAPGLLGLLEARPVVERWKPQILGWLDATEHFFNHLFAEFRDQPAFEPIRLELEEIRNLDVSLPVRNRFLFHHLKALTRELERTALAAERELPEVLPRGPLEALEPREPLEALDVPGPDASSAVSLAGPWKAHYRRSRGEYVDRVVSLPVNWELLPDIENYAGTMRFTKVFRIDDLPDGRRAVLRFDGVDYFADLWVNGHYVGGHEGYFAPFEFDVSAFLRPGEENLLRLAVTSPNDPAGPGLHVTSGWGDFAPSSSFPNRKTLVKGTLGHHDARRGGAWSSLTSQDGNTGGVWNDIALRVTNPVHFTLPGPRITTLSATEGSTAGESRVRLHLAYAITNPGGRPLGARLRVALEPANFESASHEVSRNIQLPADGRDVVVEIEVEPVRLWEPRDAGFPHLYRVTSMLEVDGEVQDRAVVETGFRTLAISPIGESKGPNGSLVVNGRPLFVRGTNLLPTYWLSEHTVDRIARDFDMLTDAGWNAVLVHTLVLPKRFYEEANRRGFLVQQIFPLQWSYEQSGEFQARATAQLREMAALLVNEPSVVSYEVHNEPDMRIAEDLDNRLMDFDLHLTLREADPSRWATTFSAGNHAYPGQFYPLRDDNSFATLPARFLEEEVHGRRISRHRNMPTEFGIQAMPNVELFRQLLSEERVSAVLRRIRTDPKWLAAGAESWDSAARTMAEVKDVLGGGTWADALEALDWSLLGEFPDLEKHIARLESGQPQLCEGDARELLSCRLALLVLDVLHYGAFKGENFWFGLWRPSQTLDEFVASSQDRQYRLHKDAIETYLNAGVVGPIVGYFSFMFRDADWQAPTWGVVDAAWVPKKAYRAYLESNHALRVSLPHALRTPIKFPGDPWFTRRGDDWEQLDERWVSADVIVGNDTARAFANATVTVWLEDQEGEAVPLIDTAGAARDQLRVSVEVDGQAGWSGTWAGPVAVVPPDVKPGTYYLRASVAAEGDDHPGSTNSYEFIVLDREFAELASVTKPEVKALLDGHRIPGFHYWHGGHVAHRARPGMRGLLRGFREAQERGIDLYEVVQGEHLFRHALHELAGLDRSEFLAADIWCIRSEIVSPREKARALLRYLELFVARAEDRLEQAKPARRTLHGVARPKRPRWPGTESAAFPPAGRDIDPRTADRGGPGEG